MKKILFLAAVTAVVLSSCSKNEVTDSVDSTLTPIGFTSYAGSATKATAETGFVSTDVFVVDAYYTAGSDMEDATGEGATLAAFMQDQTVTYGGSAWTY
ncbi:MAG: lipoprotein, partial [Rikenellaceae bacterium]